jgi:hypothetical protein
MNNNFFIFINYMIIHHGVNNIVNLIIIILSYRYTEIRPVNPLLFSEIILLKKYVIII